MRSRREFTRVFVRSELPTKASGALFPHAIGFVGKVGTVAVTTWKDMELLWLCECLNGIPPKGHFSMESD